MYIKLSKFWGIELCSHMWNFENHLTCISINFDVNYTGDHKELFINLVIFNWINEFNIYDSRHEDYNEY